MEQDLNAEGTANQDLAEGYRDHEDTLREVLDSDFLPFKRIDRLDIGWLASGEVTLRWRTVGGEEYDGTVLPPPEHSA